MSIYALGVAAIVVLVAIMVIEFIRANRHAFTESASEPAPAQVKVWHYDNEGSFCHWADAFAA